MAFKIFLFAFALCVCINLLLFTMIKPSLFRNYEDEVGRSTTFSRLASLRIATNILTEQSPSVNVFTREMEWAEIPDIALLKSGYFDDRQDSPVIRITALLFSIHSCSREYICFFVEDSTVVGYSSANCVIINYNDKMTPVFFECQPPQLLNHTTFVTIRLRSNITTAENILNAKTLLLIQRKNIRGEPTEVISCMSPLFDFQWPDKLFLFIEYYKEQGVSHFFIYHESSNENTKSLLRKLSNSGIITVIQSTQPKGFQFYYHGQIFYINDCILKGYLRNAKFVLTVDVDEFIWPQMSNMTLKQLLDIKDTANSGSIDFRSAFLWVQKKKEALVFGNMSRIFNPNDRSKQALKPKAIYQQIVHQTWRYFPTYKPNYQHISDAMIYHLRSTNGTIVGNSNLFGNFIERIVMRHNLIVDGFSSGSEFGTL